MKTKSLSGNVPNAGICKALLITTRYTHLLQLLMNTISINYQLKWRIKDTPYYITICKKVVNNKTGRFKKKSVNNGVIGYWIGRKFVGLKQLNLMCEVIKKDKCPF